MELEKRLFSNYDKLLYDVEKHLKELKFWSVVFIVIVLYHVFLNWWDFIW